MKPTTDHFSETSKFIVPTLNSTQVTDKLPKFSIPKLQKKNSIQKNTDLEYNSLSELVETHLSLIKPNCVSLKRFENASVTNNSATSSKTMDLTKDTAELSLSNSEKLVIDLTNALATPESKSLFTRKEKVQSVQNFEIPFIDCETEVAQQMDILKCTLDISDALFLKCSNFKGASKFGKALCRNYKKVRLYKINLSHKSVNSMMFTFAAPSPDDIILSRLRKVKC